MVGRGRLIRTVISSSAEPSPLPYRPPLARDPVGFGWKGCARNNATMGWRVWLGRESTIAVGVGVESPISVVSQNATTPFPLLCCFGEVFSSCVCVFFFGVVNLCVCVWGCVLFFSFYQL